MNTCKNLQPSLWLQNYLLLTLIVCSTAFVLLSTKWTYKMNSFLCSLISLSLSLSFSCYLSPSLSIAYHLFFFYRPRSLIFFPSPHPCKAKELPAFVFYHDNSRKDFLNSEPFDPTLHISFLYDALSAFFKKKTSAVFVVIIFTSDVNYLLSWFCFYCRLNEPTRWTHLSALFSSRALSLSLSYSSPLLSLYVHHCHYPHHCHHRHHRSFQSSSLSSSLQPSVTSSPSSSTSSSVSSITIIIIITIIIHIIITITIIITIIIIIIIHIIITIIINILSDAAEQKRVKEMGKSALKDINELHPLSFYDNNHSRVAWFQDWGVICITTGWME